MADGGQPSHPVSLGFGVLDNPGQYKDILWVWHEDCRFQAEFRKQLITWQKFREYQKKIRGWYVKRHRFHEYQNAVRQSQEDAQCAWNITVREDQRTHDRFQDWVEFRAFYHRKLIGQRKRMGTAQEEYSPIKKELDDLEPGLSGSTLVPEDSPLAKAMEADKRKQDARTRAETAERRLLQARVSGPRDATTHNAAIEEAEQELQLAEKLWELQLRFCRAEGNLYQEQRRVKKWTMFLKWVDDQYPAIAAGCGYCASGLVKDVPLPKKDRTMGRKSRCPARQGRRLPRRSVLSPNFSSKIFKSTKDRLRCRQKVQPVCSDRSLADTKQERSLEEPVPLRRSERLRTYRTRKPAQGLEMSSLRPVHSSRVSKTKAK